MLGVTADPSGAKGSPYALKLIAEKQGFACSVCESGGSELRDEEQVLQRESGDCDVASDAFSESNGDQRMAFRRLNDAADFIINLSAVDGAVVVTDTFRVIGFGAEIILDASPAAVSVFADDRRAPTGEISIDAFGTRHRSAFRLCSAQKDVVVFVVSQDGDVRGVMALPTGGAGLWPDVALGHRVG